MSDYTYVCAALVRVTKDFGDPGGGGGGGGGRGVQWAWSIHRIYM